MPQLVRSARCAIIAISAPLALMLVSACNDDDDPTGTGGNSTQLVFASDRDNAAAGTLDVYTANADGSDVRRLTTTPGDDGEPVWSSTGRIAFTSSRDGNDEIYSMNADGSDVKRLTNNTAADGLPAWSPNGSRIAFTSNRDGNLEIYVMNADGTNQTRLTNSPATETGARWSPNGSRIAFHS